MPGKWGGELNMRTPIERKTLAYFALSVIGSLAFGGCSLLQSGQSKTSFANLSQSPPIENFVGTAGIKNVNQLLVSMATVTNIPLSSLAPGGANSAISQQYAIIAPFLSSDGSVASINPAMLLSVTGLAGQVCQVFVAGEAASPNVLRGAGVNFSGATSQFTSPPATATNNVINALANQFWGRAPTSAELSTLSSALQSATTETSAAGSALNVQQVLIVPCTIMLSSPAFLLG